MFFSPLTCIRTAIASVVPYGFIAVAGVCRIEKRGREEEESEKRRENGEGEEK
jgi:hypothetical protein